MITQIKLFAKCLFYTLLLYSHLAVSQVPNKGGKIRNMAGKEVEMDSLNHFTQVLMGTLQVPGVSMAIINNGEVVYHHTAGYADIEKKEKVSANTIFEAASLSKPLFAFLVMGFVEQGVLNLDTPLYEYLPYSDIAHDDRYKKITARMVLSHTSGFPNWRTDYESKALFIQFDPGTSFFYSGEGYQYLAKVLAHLNNTNDLGLEQIFQKRIARPLKLLTTKFIQDENNLKNKATGYVGSTPKLSTDDPNVFGAAFSVHAEALDFSKWLVALLNKELISETSYSELLGTQIVLPEDHEQRQLGVTEWTLGFAKAQLPTGLAFGHGGNNPGYTSLFAIVPETKWGLVIFTNADQSQLPLGILQYLMTP